MVHTFPKGICLKVNIIARQEFELVFYDFAVHRFNHYIPWHQIIHEGCYASKNKKSNHEFDNQKKHLTSNES